MPSAGVARSIPGSIHTMTSHQRPRPAHGSRRIGSVLAAATLCAWALLASVEVRAQDCAQASQDFNALNGAPVRDRQAMESAARAVRSACGEAPGQAPLSAPATLDDAPRRQPPGPFVRCDRTGCFGSANNLRYTYVDGGNLQGEDGSYCVRGANKRYSCN